MNDEIKDATQEVVDDKTGDVQDQEKATDIADDNKAQAAEERATDDLSEVLDTYGFASIEEMAQAAQEGVKFKKEDVEKALAAQQELDRIHAYWAEQEALKKEQDELPEETIARLKREKREQESQYRKMLEDQQATESELKALESYSSEINSILGKEQLSKEEKSFAAKFFGVNNPFNEIDIDNKVAVRKMVKDGLAEYKAFRNKIIEDYRKGKIDVPEMTKSDQTSVTSSEKKVKNIKDASKLFAEMLSKK